MKGRDLVSQKFGRLEVVSEGPKKVRADDRSGERMWNCRCDCGRTKAIRQSSLLRGHTTSCGCLLAEHAAAMGRAKRKSPIASTAKSKRPKAAPVASVGSLLSDDDLAVDRAIHGMVTTGRRLDSAAFQPIVPRLTFQ